ncbi:MAG: NAD(P)-dependent alcohol dehydrogenase [Spirochaetaceae bacterium]
MRAIIWNKYGSADFLELQNIQKPEPKDNEILIKVYNTSVNAGDCEMRSLKFPFILKLLIRMFFGPFKPRNIILGQEISGVIEEVGKKVTKFKVGDELFGATGLKMGGYAEYVSVSDKGCFILKPQCLTFQEAAVISIGGLEARHYLKKFNINKNDKVLINGAGGSIGTIALQIAKHQGASVTVVDKKSKFEMLTSLGADRVIDYTNEDFTAEDNKYDLIFDVVGKSPFKKSIDILYDNGNYVIANPKFYHKFLGRLINLFSNKKIHFDTSDHSISDLEYIKGLVEGGIIKVFIDKVIKLENIAEAHKYVEAGDKRGNLIIEVSK